MLYNIILGFVIPWIFGICLYKKNPKVVILIAPISSILAHSVNVFGGLLKYWKLQPTKLGEFSVIPFELGIYAVIPCFMIHIIKNKKVAPYISILLFTAVLTIQEYIYIKLGRVIYNNGWTIYFTFFSYLIPNFMVYKYYKLLGKFNILE